MSENLDLVRSIYAAWEHGDYGSFEWAHPEIEWDFAADGPTPELRTGVAEMEDTWRAYTSDFEGTRHKADQYIELDGERVLVLQHLSGRGKASGLDLDRLQSLGAAVLFHIRDGRVTRLIGYFDRANALADLGLKE